MPSKGHPFRDGEEGFEVNRWNDPTALSRRGISKELSYASFVKTIKVRANYSMLGNAWANEYRRITANEGALDIFNYNCADVTLWLMNQVGFKMSSDRPLFSYVGFGLIRAPLQKKFLGITLPGRVFNDIKLYENSAGTITHQLLRAGIFFVPVAALFGSVYFYLA
jgi:hypothetical protein